MCDYYYYKSYVAFIVVNAFGEHYFDDTYCSTNAPIVISED